MTKHLGLDPGSISAAWALLDSHTDLALCGDVPVVDKMVDAVGFANLVRRLQPDCAMIERVSAMPRQGSRSGFRFGQGVGTLRGVIGALQIPLHQVSAGKWKRSFGLDADKEKTRALAIRLYPKLQAELSRKKDHGRSEALLIARWFAEQRLNVRP